MSPRRPFWRRVLLPVFVSVLGLNLLALAAWTLPHGYRQRNAAAREQAARREVEGSRKLVAELRERANRVRSNAADVQRFYGKHLAGNVSEFVEAVETMARAPGLKPGGRSFSNEKLDGVPLERVTMTLPLGGSYGELVGFLRELERSPRFITIDGIGMRAEEASGAALQVQLSTYLTARGEGGRKGRRGAL